MAIYFNRQAIIKFYTSIGFTNFNNLEEERIVAIDDIALRSSFFMAYDTITLGSLMTRCAEKLTTSSRNFGLLNGDEAIYFYIKIVDPDFLFLEAYESANKKEEIKPLCLQNFKIYDPTLIYFEKIFQRKFKLESLKDLWARERINTHLINMASPKEKKR